MCLRSDYCRVCGEEIDPCNQFCAGSRYGRYSYCSTRCNLIGQAWTYFALAIVLFISLCGGFLYRNIAGKLDYPEANIFLILTGVFSLIFSISSAIGFRLRKTADIK